MLFHWCGYRSSLHQWLSNVIPKNRLDCTKPVFIPSSSQKSCSVSSKSMSRSCSRQLIQTFYFLTGTDKNRFLTRFLWNDSHTMFCIFLVDFLLFDWCRSQDPTHSVSLFQFLPKALFSSFINFHLWHNSSDV